ncbi:hypothetical protein Syun_000371 [Stephania yunnanensis]|uniref:Maternal effect embryo arrest 59 n=1 Tax=Stephania yunnanensis TaxID=152371 RepID=A0AAP0LC14_9MAGN
MSTGRPSRSDVHLSQEEEAKIEEETRDYFDDLAPKRHSKPQRSEHSSQYSDSLSNDALIPELTKFEHLESEDHKKLVYNGSEATEEFVETEYYKDLNCVGKQHHTTGTGFISMGSSNGRSCFSLVPDSDTTCHSSRKGNPATNDWVPAPPQEMNWSSDKPHRSDN